MRTYFLLTGNFKLKATYLYLFPFLEKTETIALYYLVSLCILEVCVKDHWKTRNGKYGLTGHNIKIYIENM